MRGSRTPAVVPIRVQPMLATLVSQPFHRDGWVYEEKYDGYRLLAYKEGNRISLWSRNSLDKTAAFSEIARSIEGLSARTLLLDGEAVAFDAHGISRFQFLQRGAIQSQFAIFDCLYVDGCDLRKEPLSSRRSALETAIGDTHNLFASRRLAPNGLTAYKQADKRGLEGMIAKDASAPYIEGRSKLWLKCKVHQEEEFVIGGYTAPAGARNHFGALLLGAYEGDNLRYVGKVGTGFTQNSLQSLHRAFAPLLRQKPSIVDPPRERDVTYLLPKLVAQIAFQEWTADNKLRQPVFLGLRDDKKPRECQMPR